MLQPRITFVTCDSLPGLDPDDLLLFDHLQRRDWLCHAAVWNDGSINWSEAGIILIRSTWDYHLAPQKFLSWAESCSDALINSYRLVRWNAHKGYIVELAENGVPTVPTRIINSAHPNIQSHLSECGWNQIVIKPAIGLATHGVKRFDLNDSEERKAACEHVASLTSEGDVLLQPFLPSVADYGERALVFFGGKFSHAVRKTPFQALAVAGQAGETAVQATADEIAVGKVAIASVPEPPVYARVDLVRDPNNRPVVIELELIEPSLFLSFDSSAVERFASVLNDVISKRGRSPANSG